jgi:hypothetical protein
MTMHRNSTLCQVRQTPRQVPPSCESCEKPAPIWLLWFGDDADVPYALCGSCSADCRDMLAAFGQAVDFTPVLTLVVDVPLPFPSSCPNCKSTVLDVIGDDSRAPAAALVLCLDCSGIVGVVG